MTTPSTTKPKNHPMENDDADADDSSSHRAQDATSKSAQIRRTNRHQQQQQDQQPPRKPILQESVEGDVHRRRTLYLVRHGEAEHNVLEAAAQERAKQDAKSRNLSEEETRDYMEQERKAVLLDPSLRDAPLTEEGREQARDCAARLESLIDQGLVHPPTEAMVSPLARTLETCHIILDTVNPEIKAHIRPEIQERQTRYPPDTPRRYSSLYQYTFCDDRFVMDHIEQVDQKDVDNEVKARESREMLRDRAAHLFHLLMEMHHRRHVLIVSHKGYLRELERGLLGLEDSPLFGNAELRVYRVEFTRGKRELESLERLV